ncbi:MAG: hypothetical protein A3G33_04160 [Omnitrophica bacterium RIFCSPLOWO2_12_FULL_44_17]|uniref:NlpC/P60 domain-containing protein n=1 Tax=Candidatus Danuiimicrobium aquiferis TaxID=1801832 RepID=A0A1G1KQD3_9BACT|nr:MAG: hypothetical protein A3B72_10365 [Omnitrophica bacterium RIFCSPHIGHO2_02_FULL_45_28]OGW90928.1 MAG: hypothetical protein A3E74_00490 [Omnitrophica bacterium RIFCSPHIGHO2_12_FULL_44_12]OGW95133.1 MAG: hypothetical protein A3G33_04160 [Omnitrophica bacterium RIFCSPLOWO2_12_FULL_44_17]OGX01722.1 MAG: hypothetical protein A3J12_04275 [Omnitrophica bacterium RIFCSPLOWO2_02_FULL_44_11]
MTYSYSLFRKFFQCLIFMIAILCGMQSVHAEDEELPLLPQGPLLFKFVTPEMFQADYWINLLPDPDRVLKTPQELKFFNWEITQMTSERVDLFAMELEKPGSVIRRVIEADYKTVSNRKLFDVYDKYVPKSFFETEVLPILGTDQIPSTIKIQWGAATRATSVRALPTMKKVLEEKADYEFDQLQFTQIKLWTPVAIYHRTMNSEWYFVQAPYSRGWVKAKDIAVFDSRDEVKRYAKSDSFLDVTGESAPVCFDPLCDDGTGTVAAYFRPSMGTVIPFSTKDAANYVVYLPIRGSGGNVSIRKAYLSRKADVTEGFPAFTQRNIIKQAFKLLGARYGWGGQYDGRDCSGFTHDVYLSMGVDMPRDSKYQGLIGTQLGHFEYGEESENKLITLEHAIPGTTILRMPKHLMLYLGKVNGRHYIIHSTWAERIGTDPVADEKNRINQVVLSDLSLNGDSYLGSLFERIISMNDLN